MERAWPVVDGTFVVGDPGAPVAVCTLTTEGLSERLAAAPGAAISGQVYTANLGIERIVQNVTANPAIRFLLVCGKDSKLFRPGQSLGALVDGGIDDARRIVGAEGYDPVLPTVEAARVERFRRQVGLVDWTGEDDPRALEEEIAGLASRSPGRFETEGHVAAETTRPAESRAFVPMRPGGRREPLQYDPKGYFVITIDREGEQIVLQHYLPDHTPAHEMRGRLAESMFLGLVRGELVSQLSHAGYLGGELAKAEAALHLGLRYRQDRPLARLPGSGEEGIQGEAKRVEKAPIAPPFTLEQLRHAGEGADADVVLEVSEVAAGGELVGTALEPDEKQPFNAFHRTEEPLRARRTDETRIVMGGEEDLVAGAILRVRGPLRTGRLIETSSIVVLTHVASAG
jgi:tetrahydromethanopterin S-methyltransferase subunit A